jgi:hypothetical protein
MIPTSRWGLCKETTRKTLVQMVGYYKGSDVGWVGIDLILHNQDR